MMRKKGLRNSEEIEESLEVTGTRCYNVTELLNCDILFRRDVDYEEIV